MTAIRFQWDDKKAAANRAKHGVSFEEAKSVFYDDDALLRSDDEHSNDEDRFVLLGLSANLRVLVVCHCHRESDEVVRLLSARKADRSERQQYEARRKR